MKSGTLNLLETSRPVQACNGIVLTFYLKQLRQHSVGYTVLTGFRFKLGNAPYNLQNLTISRQRIQIRSLLDMTPR